MNRQIKKPSFVYTFVSNLIFNVLGVSMILCGITCCLLAISLYLVFFYAPTEQVMGDVQRIFYFHVSSAWIAFLAFFLVMVASIKYLRTNQRKWDVLAYASAEIGTLFCTVVLLTGPLWAKPVWNVWWTWDLRLTTTLVLWLMYMGYLLLRKYVEGERGAKYAAVFGIIAFLDVPFVYFSIRVWRTLHPAPVIMGGKGAGLAPEMLTTLLVCVITFMCLFAYLLQHRITIISIQDELEELRRTIAEREQDMRGDILIENENFIIEDYTCKEYQKKS
jgi:heme exporter protein C